VHLKNVLLATRKLQGRMNYKLVSQAKIRPKQLQHYYNLPPPHPLTLPNQQPDFGCHGLRARVKPCVAQCQISWLTTTSKHKQVCHTWSTVTFEHRPLNQNARKQKLQKNNRNICVTRVFNLASATQITFETYN
jgi:hypothetical protein